MSLKVWVKRSGVTDDEALGIYVPVNGTAQSVVEACGAVFRHLRPLEVALRTEDGIIVAMTSPATALQSHILEIVNMPQSEVSKRHSDATTLRPLSHMRNEPVLQKQLLERKGVRVVSFGVPKKKQSPRGKGDDGVLPYNHKCSSTVPEVRKKDVSAQKRLALLWDSLPAFTPEPLDRNAPAVEKVLQAARYIYLTDPYKLFAGDRAPFNMSSSVSEEEDEKLDSLGKSSRENKELSDNPGTYANNENHDNAIQRSDVTCGEFTEGDNIETETHTVDRSDLPPSGDVVTTVANTDEVSSLSNSIMLQCEATVSGRVSSAKEEIVLLEREGTSSVVVNVGTDYCDVEVESNSNITGANLKTSEEKKELKPGCEVVVDSPDQNTTYFDEW